jgi:hypothetical protein
MHTKNSRIFSSTPSVPKEVFYGTQYHTTVVRWYYRFFPMGTMVICFMCSIWKQIGICHGVILHLPLHSWLALASPPQAHPPCSTAPSGPRESSGTPLHSRSLATPRRHNLQAPRAAPPPRHPPCSPAAGEGIRRRAPTICNPPALPRRRHLQSLHSRAEQARTGASSSIPCAAAAGASSHASSGSAIVVSTRPSSSAPTPRRLVTPR